MRDLIAYSLLLISLTYACKQRKQTDASAALSEVASGDFDMLASALNQTEVFRDSPLDLNADDTANRSVNEGFGLDAPSSGPGDLVDATPVAVSAMLNAYDASLRVSASECSFKDETDYGYRCEKYVGKNSEDLGRCIKEDLRSCSNVNSTVYSNARNKTIYCKSVCYNRVNYFVHSHFAKASNKFGGISTVCKASSSILKENWNKGRWSESTIATYDVSVQSFVAGEKARMKSAHGYARDVACRHAQQAAFGQVRQEILTELEEKILGISGKHTRVTSEEFHASLGGNRRGLAGEATSTYYLSRSGADNTQSSPEEAGHVSQFRVYTQPTPPFKAPLWGCECEEVKNISADESINELSKSFASQLKVERSIRGSKTRTFPFYYDKKTVIANRSPELFAIDAVKKELYTKEQFSDLHTVAVEDDRKAGFNYMEGIDGGSKEQSILRSVPYDHLYQDCINRGGRLITESEATYFKPEIHRFVSESIGTKNKAHLTKYGYNFLLDNLGTHFRLIEDDARRGIMRATGDYPYFEAKCGFSSRSKEGDIRDTWAPSMNCRMFVNVESKDTEQQVQIFAEKMKPEDRKEFKQQALCIRTGY